MVWVGNRHAATGTGKDVAMGTPLAETGRPQRGEACSENSWEVAVSRSQRAENQGAAGRFHLAVAK